MVRLACKPPSIFHSALDTAEYLRHDHCVTPFPYHRRLLRVWLFAVVLACAATTWLVGAGSANAQQKAEQQGAQLKRGWLGIAMQEKPGGIVLVEDVFPGSPAHKVGLRIGDRILRVNGTDVLTSRDTARLVGKNGVGKTVAITFSRNGTEQTVRVALEPTPSRDELLRMQLVGRPAPPLQGLVSTDGTPVRSWESFRGKVVVLDFWASFCQACRASVPSMNGLHARHATRGLVMLGIAGEPAETVARGAQQFGKQYTSYADPDTTTSAAYHVRDLPSVIVIDRKGIVRDVATGFYPARLRQLEALIERLLAEPPPTQ